MQGRQMMREAPEGLWEHFCKGSLNCEQRHVVFHLCESDPGVGCGNFHYLISAYEEFEDEEQLPTASTDEDMLF